MNLKSIQSITIANDVGTSASRRMSGNTDLAGPSLRKQCTTLQERNNGDVRSQLLGCASGAFTGHPPVGGCPYKIPDFLNAALPSSS